MLTLVGAAFADSAFAHAQEVEGQRRASQLGRHFPEAVAVCVRRCFALTGAGSCGVRPDQTSCGGCHMKAHR